MLPWKIKIVEPAKRYGSEFADISFTDEFFLFQKKRYGLESSLLVLENDQGELLGTLPFNYSEQDRSFFAVYKNYTFPDFKNFEKIDWLDLARELKNNFQFNYIEFRVAFMNGQAPKNLKRMPLSSYLVETKGNETQEDLLNIYFKKTRNQVRKGLKSRLEVSLLKEDSLEKIYALYKDSLKRHGTPPRDLDYFKDLFSCFNDKALVVGAFDNQELIGVNFAVRSEKTLRLYFNFSKDAYWSKCVNNLLYHKMMQIGQSFGVSLFDFGTCADADYSHLRFKLGFGAKAAPLWSLRYGSLKKKIYFFFQYKARNFKIRLNRLFN